MGIKKGGVQHSGKRFTKSIIPFLVSKLGEYEERKQWYNFRCPFHGGENTNFGVNLQTNIYYCWSCGKKGGIESLVLRLYGKVFDPSAGQNGGLLGNVKHDLYQKAFKSPTVEDNFKRPEGREGPAAGENDMVLNDPRGKKRILFPDNESVKMAFSGDNKLNSLNYIPFINDDKNRILKNLQEDFNRNFMPLNKMDPCIIRDRAIKYLTGRGIDIKLVETGILKGLENRITFPFRYRGQLVFWQSRSVASIPIKTINCEEDKGWLPKGKVVYNYDKLDTDTVCISEGIFDCLSIGQHTGMDSIPLLGKNISDLQIYLLKSKAIKKVFVFLDNDANREAVKLAIQLYYSGFDVHCIIWPQCPDKQDPNSIEPDYLVTLLKNSVHIGPVSAISLNLEYF